MLCRSLKFSRVKATRWPWLLTALLVLAAVPAFGRAADVEMRDFRVIVDKNPVGDAHMTFERKDDGSLTLNCDTAVRVKFLFIQYLYKYSGKEVWKDGRLQSFESTCTDDGKSFAVAAAAQGQNVLVRVTNMGQQEERTVSGDVWLSSYWKQPDAKLVNQTIPIIDADNGKDVSAKVVYVGAEQRGVGGQIQQTQHYRLEGKNTIDLWYDATGRLVRQDWMEQNHRTVLELSRIRR
jgi:Family of unknown function (DUF6134)